MELLMYLGEIFTNRLSSFTSKKISNEYEDELELPNDKNEFIIYSHFKRSHNLLMKAVIDNKIKSTVVNHELNIDLKELNSI